LMLNHFSVVFRCGKVGQQQPVTKPPHSLRHHTYPPATGHKITGFWLVTSHTQTPWPPLLREVSVDCSGAHYGAETDSAASRTPVTCPRALKHARTTGQSATRAKNAGNNIPPSQPGALPAGPAVVLGLGDAAASCVALPVSVPAMQFMPHRVPHCGHLLDVAVHVRHILPVFGLGGVVNKGVRAEGLKFLRRGYPAPA
jgi:hypothetical protein